MTAKDSGTGTPTRASTTTAPRRPRDVGTPYVPKPKNPRGKVDATRYGRKVGTPYVPKSKQIPTAGKAANTAGKIAIGNIGKGFAPGTLMGPAKTKRPVRGPGGTPPKPRPVRGPGRPMRPVRGPGRGPSKPKLPKAY